MRFLVASLLFSGFASFGLTVKILADFPISAPSHHFFFQPILHALANRGHEIDYFSPIPLKTSNVNITVFPLINYMDRRLKLPLFDLWKLPVLKRTEIIWNTYLSFEEWLCQTKPVQDLIASNTKYDILIHEGMYLFESSTVFQHKFNVPSVALLAIPDSFHVNEYAGLVNNPSFMVNAISDSNDSMDFFDRLYNAYQLAATLYLHYDHVGRLQTIVDKCYTYPGWKSRPPLLELLSNQSLILINSHVSVGYPFPRPPNVKEIGGAVVRPRKPLPKDLEEFINDAEEGVIYFSLGSLFPWKNAEVNLKDIFANVFSRRTERVLWRWNGDPWHDVPRNLRLSEWFPQQDVLAHTNVKLFITHAGMQSYFEAVNFAVPMIAIPTHADQTKNAAAIVRLNYGVLLTLNNITEESLNWAIDETLYKSKYKERIQKGSAVLKDSPMDPVNEGVYWIEYVLRHGRVLQAYGSRLSWIQLHLVDVYAFILATVALSIYSVKRLIS